MIYGIKAFTSDMALDPDIVHTEESVIENDAESKAVATGVTGNEDYEATMLLLFAVLFLTMIIVKQK